MTADYVDMTLQTLISRVDDISWNLKELSGEIKTNETKINAFDSKIKNLSSIVAAINEMQGIVITLQIVLDTLIPLSLTPENRDKLESEVQAKMMEFRKKAEGVQKNESDSIPEPHN